MKKEVALFTEWAWANKVITRPEKLTAFAHVIFEKLQDRFPNTRASRKHAVAELQKDIWKVLKVLSYGGRKASSISKERLEFLDNVSYEFFVEHREKISQEAA